jgi:hypothetical protein
MALSGATSVTFTATIAGGFGTNVTWDFGDGSVASGQFTPHTFTADDGTVHNFLVKATAIIGSQQGVATVSVPVRSLTGTWIQSGVDDVFALTQTGTQLSGSDQFNHASNHDVRNGAVANVRSATWDRFDNLAGTVQDRVSVTADQNLSQLAGTFTHRDGTVENVTLVRQ